MELISRTATTEQELSTELQNDYIILFRDDTIKKMSKERGEAIMEMSASSAKFFKLDGSMYNFSDIAKLMPIREYWNQYPDERPVSYPKIDIPDDFKNSLFNSVEFIEHGLRIWKKQHSDPSYVPKTGGLKKLIDWGEARLIKLKEDKIRRLTINAIINMSKNTGRLFIPEETNKKKTKAEILENIRLKRTGKTV